MSSEESAPVIDGLKEEIFRVVRDKVNLELEVKQLTESLKVSRNEEARMRAKILKLEESVGMAAEKEEGMARKYSALVSEKNEMERMLTEKRDSHEYEIAELLGEVGRVRDVMDEFKGSHKELQEKNEQLLSQVDEVMLEKDNMTKGFEMEKDKVENLELEVAGMKGKLEQAEAKLGKMRNERGMLNKRNKELENNVDVLKKEKEALQNTLLQAQRESGDLNKDVARTVCTIYARICMIFGDSAGRKHSLGLGGGSPPMQNECGLMSPGIDFQMTSDKLKRNRSKKNGYQLSSTRRVAAETRGAISRTHIDLRREELAYLQFEDLGFPCGTSPGRLFMECLSLSSSVSNFGDDDDGGGYVIDHEEQFCQIPGIGNSVKKRETMCLSGGLNHAQTVVPSTAGDPRQVRSGVQSCSAFGPKSGLAVYAPPSTLGGCALALHYANVIIVIEKLLSYSHLVGDEARDDLYQMLPTSLRLSLKAKLRTYVKNLAIYDAPLAHEWKVKLDSILRWLSPLAHSMIRWQSERNFEQHQIVSKTNVLLFQTLYFADRGKTEDAMCELLIGLNYICRYEQQQNALLGCASSFDFEDCMRRQLRCGASFLN